MFESKEDKKDDFFDSFGNFGKPKIINIKPTDKELKKIEKIRKEGIEVSSLEDLQSLGFGIIHKTKLEKKTFYYMPIKLETEAGQNLGGVYFCEE